MRCDAFMEESLSYKAIRALYSCFIASLSFKVFAGSARSIYRVSGEIIHNSDSRRLFISTCSACRSSILYFTPAFKLSTIKNAIKYAASIYRNSYTFRLINKKI